MISEFENHLWQSTLFAGVIGLLTLALRSNRAAVRHRLWFAASVKFLVPFSLLVGIGSQVEWRKAPAVVQPRLSSMIEEVSRPFAAPAPAPLLAPELGTPGRAWAVLFGVLWLCGFAANSLAWWRCWHRVRRALRAASPLSLNLPIRTMSSPMRLEPGVFGIFNPVLLLPEGIERRLTPAQLKAVFAHELCHVRRLDNLTAAIHMVVEALFWFHPLVWWIQARLVEERERACDEEVLRMATDPKDYAEGIVNVCRFYLESPLVCVSGITGADLKRRVTDIMTGRAGRNLSPVKKFILVVTALAAVCGPLATGLLRGQAGRAPQETAQSGLFAAVSVKPDAQKGPGYETTWRVDPITLNITGQTLKQYVQQAYDLKSYQVLLQGPGWIGDRAVRFDIQARTAQPATKAEMMLMLRPVLSERFHLGFHRETRQMSVYFLRTERYGAKLQAATTTEGPNGGVYSGGVADFTHESMDDFADVLGRFMTDRPVFNRTGLVKEYQFKLEFAPPDDDASEHPSIFSALREQLGLRLEVGKALVNVLVIDHADRPQPN